LRGFGGVLPYREPRRGDIIVFRYPLNISMDYVKRAIGLPGDLRFDALDAFDRIFG
jgi:signal peptidase I